MYYPGDQKVLKLRNLKVAITQLAMDLLHHDTVHQKVDKQHIGQKASIFNSFRIISDLLN